MAFDRYEWFGLTQSEHDSSGKDAYDLHMSRQLSTNDHTSNIRIFHIVYMSIDDTVRSIAGDKQYLRTKIPNFLDKPLGSGDTFISSVAHTVSNRASHARSGII